MLFAILIDLYEQKLEQLDQTTEYLLRNSQKLFAVKMTQLEQLESGLLRNHPDEKIQKAKEEQNEQTKALSSSYDQSFYPIKKQNFKSNFQL